MSLNLSTWTVLFFFGIVTPAFSADELPSSVQFVRQTCLDCHEGESAEADFRLDDLTAAWEKPQEFARWVKVYDRVNKGEMPPSDAEQPATKDRQAFLSHLENELRTQNLKDQTRDGRVQYRRLNRFEYESTLRDLLALPNLEVREMLPPDSSASGFDNVGSALDLSYVQIARYLDAANEALDKAMVLAPKPSSQKTRLIAKTNGRLSQVLNKREEAVPVGNAVGLLRQPNTAQAPWWWSKFFPSMDGDYRIRMKTFGFLWDKGTVKPADRLHAITYQAVQGSTKRPLGTFDIGRTEQDAEIHDFTAFIKQGDSLEMWFETLDDRNKGRQRLLDDYTAPGVAVEWIEIEGPIYEEWPPASYRALFGDLPLEPWTEDTGLKQPPFPMVINGVGKRAKKVPAKPNKVTLMHVVSQNPKADAQRLLTDFASRAFRRPVAAEDIRDIFALVEQKLDQKECFQEAMRVGFQAVLCAPEFLFFQEQPGKLDQYALAARLSYFLWSSLPDAELRQLADDEKLHRPDVLREQVERMLNDPKSVRFVESFCGQWLDLRSITVSQADEELYPESDRWLIDSMVPETHAYFRKMLRNDLSVTYVIDSDFAMINSRLAEHYGIPGIEGVAIREVKLPDDSPRGGLLTQGSVLKVTANGTTTSPVTRGAWVIDRIVGQPAPLPPPNVPAIEPDLRGAVTIRQQLDKHRNVAGCASCHKAIDPPGFALENFDVIGGWRTRYRSLGKGKNAKATFKDNRAVRYKLGLPVDAGGTAPNGQSFENIDGFREILIGQKEQLARNLVERFLVYGTGAELQFADRAAVESILDQSAKHEYGLRTLIHQVVQSPTFQQK